MAFSGYVNRFNKTELIKKINSERVRLNVGPLNLNRQSMSCFTFLLYSNSLVVYERCKSRK